MSEHVSDARARGQPIGGYKKRGTVVLMDNRKLEYDFVLVEDSYVLCWDRTPKGIGNKKYWNWSEVKAVERPGVQE